MIKYDVVSIVYIHWSLPSSSPAEHPNRTYAELYWEVFLEDLILQLPRVLV